MNYLDKTLELINKYKSFKDKDEMINCINLLNNMMNTGIIDNTLVNKIYIKYEDDINVVNNIQRKINNNAGIITNTHYISNNNSINEIFLLRNKLIKVLCLKSTKDIISDDIKHRLVSSSDKAMYELLRSIINKC